MGIENNECVIATTWDGLEAVIIEEWIGTIDDDIQSLFVVIPALVNGRITIIMAPDGSKKGWPEAKRCEKVRDMFIDKIEELNYSDGSNSFDYVEVGFGEFGQKVLRGNCLDCYGDSEYIE